MNYAMENNSCPIEAYERAIKLKHDVYWIHANCTAVHSGEYEKESRVIVDFDTIYRFQGKYFKIIPAMNDNLSFVEVEIN